MAVVVYIPKRRTAFVDLHIAGSVVRFQLTVLEESGQSVMRAEIADEAVLRACRRLGHRVFDAAPAEDPAPSVKAPADAQAATDGNGWKYPPIVQAAINNGWRYDDITGAGRENQWGPEGGRADRSGLTMAELSLTQPPVGWYVSTIEGQPPFCGTHHPWEVLGWKHPGDGWIAPVVRMKRQSADAVPDKDEPPAPLANEPLANEPGETEPGEPKPEERPGAGANVLDEDIDDPPAVKDANRENDPTLPTELTPETRAAELLADWSSERIAEASEVIRNLWRQAGAPPSVSKASYYLRQANITGVKAPTFQVLLDLVQPTI